MVFLEQIVLEITSFGALQKFVSGQKDSLNFFESVKEYFFDLGKRLGYDSRKNSSVLRNGINFSTVDIAWSSAEKIVAGFEIEFGNKEELLSGIWKLIELEPQYAVLITSFKAKNFSLKEIEQILRHSHNYKAVSTEFLLMEIDKEFFAEIQ